MLLTRPETNEERVVYIKKIISLAIIFMLCIGTVVLAENDIVGLWALDVDYMLDIGLIDPQDVEETSIQNVSTLWFEANGGITILLSQDFEYNVTGTIIDFIEETLVGKSNFTKEYVLCGDELILINMEDDETLYEILSRVNNSKGLQGIWEYTYELSEEEYAKYCSGEAIDKESLKPFSPIRGLMVFIDDSKGMGLVDIYEMVALLAGMETTPGFSYSVDGENLVLSLGNEQVQTNEYHFEDGRLAIMTGGEDCLLVTTTGMEHSWVYYKSVIDDQPFAE